jgi:hypothetical protein
VLPGGGAPLYSRGSSADQGAVRGRMRRVVTVGLAGALAGGRGVAWRGMVRVQFDSGRAEIRGGGAAVLGRLVPER